MASQSLDQMVEETISLIDKGHETIQLDPKCTKLVLNVGNTGAGKSTVSKLLTSPHDLECYDAGDRILIRDKQHKISEKNTIVSQTLFPELFISTKTNTNYYDLPGFCDTRHESIEIANACFMKKVADHAREVKLLLVINHTSVKSGENRNELKNLLEQTVQLIPKPRQFSNSIALIATKVDTTKSAEQVIHGIAKFLENTKSCLSSVISESSERAAAEAVIDAILTRDSQGSYTRIGFFSEPKALGAITSNQFVLQETSTIEQMIQKLSYSKASPKDFGFSISSSAQNLMFKIAEKLNKKITGILEQTMKQTMDSVQAKLKSSKLEDIGTELQIVSEFEGKVALLQKVPNNKRQVFFEFLEDITEILAKFDLNIVQDISKELASLGEALKTLEFLEEISSNNYPATILEWTKPIQLALEDFKKVISTKGQTFAHEVECKHEKMCKKIVRNFLKKQKTLKDDLPLLDSLIEEYSSILTQLNEELRGTKSVNIFVQKVQQYLLILKLTSSRLNLLTTDVEFETGIINTRPWIRPYEDLQSKLMEESRLHKLKCENEKLRKEQKEKFEKAKAEQKKRMEDMEGRFQEQLTLKEKQHEEEKRSLEKRMEALKEDNARSWRRMQAVADAEREAQKKELRKLERDLQKEKDRKEERRNKRPDPPYPIIEQKQPVRSGCSGTSGLDLSQWNRPPRIGPPLVAVGKCVEESLGSTRKMLEQMSGRSNLLKTFNFK